MYQSSALLLLTLILHITGHGYLIDPPGRSSAWRAGFGTPINYDDNSLWCGGRAVHHSQNNGSCGLCGDNWALDERPNEPGPGNKYATGTIVGTYKQGKMIKVKFVITAAHLGYVELKLCDNDVPQLGLDASIRATHECVDLNLLSTKSGDKRVTIGSDAGEFEVKVKLLRKVRCSACVLQWRYRTGNSWGVEFINGVRMEGLGYGPQEEFFNCADIKIKRNKQLPPTTQVPTTSSDVQCFGILNSHNSWCAQYCPMGPCPTATCWCMGQSLPTVYDCTGATWCTAQCNRVPPYCPTSECTCVLKQVDPRSWY